MFSKSPSLIFLITFLLLSFCLFFSSSAREEIYKSSAILEQNLNNYDFTTYYDAGNILLFVPNNGEIGTDLIESFGRREGLYFPYSGDTSLISDSSEILTLMYSAGLVLTGKVDGEIRTSVGMYDSPEFVPGPMTEEVVDSALLKTFKIDNQSGAGDYDFDNWPISWGAPGDAGLPALSGTQTLWTVFNDNDSSVNHNFYGGGTKPLGIETQMTVWGSSEIDNVFYLQYKLFNKGQNSVDSLYICFWIDADIGGPNDDLTGCDSLHNIFYCYNSGAYDNLYLNSPPAFGGQVVYGPIVQSNGDTARFDQSTLPDYKNLEMTIFNSYLSGEDPLTPEQLFQCAKGLNCFSALPLTNPETGDTTLFYAPGNPITGQGWVDQHIGDKKALVSFGPLEFLPGDSQIVRLKLGAYQADNNLFSVSYLKNLLDPSIVIDTIIDTTTYFAADSASVIVEDFGLERMSFNPPKSQWLSGYNWGGRFYQGGFDYASEFFGSGLNPQVFPDSFHNVEMRFSNIVTQKAYYYLTGTLEPYEYIGYFDVPFSVYDIDNNRQLNVMIVENDVYDSYDSTWAPDPAYPSTVGELIFILNSDYSGSDPYSTPIPYPDYNVLEDADSLDLIYFFWPAIYGGYSVDDMEEGDRLDIVGQFENANGIIDTMFFTKTAPGAVDSRSVMIKCYHENPAKLFLSTSNNEAFRLSTPVLRISDTLAQRIRIDFTPSLDQQYSEYLSVFDSIRGEVLASVALVSGEDIISDIISESKGLLPKSPILYQNYPNPFNPNTLISFQLPQKSRVKLSIYNILGRRVKVLIDRELSAGTHRVEWDGLNSEGVSVASGIYLYRLESDNRDNFHDTKKMILIR